MPAETCTTETYEYRVERAPAVSGPVGIVEALNAFGAEGWALCAIDYGCWIFRRLTASVDPWKRAVIDAHVVAGSYKHDYETDPQLAVNHLVYYATEPKLAEEMQRHQEVVEKLAHSHLAVCNNWNRIVGQGGGCICKVVHRSDV